MVWDDNYTFSFHDNRPNAPYIHPQSNSHQSIIECEPPPTDLLIGETPPNVTVGETVSTQAVAASGSSALTNYPVFLSRIRGDVDIRSGSSIVPPNGDVQLATARGSSNLQLSLTPKTAGPVQVALKLAGTSIARNLTFTAVPVPAAKPDRIEVTSTVQSAGSPYLVQIVATVTSSGQPVSGVYVSFIGVSGSIRFQNGSTYLTGSGTQLQTDSTGTARASVQLNTTGESLIRISTLGASRDVTVTRPGTALSTSLVLLVKEVPLAVPVGETSSVLLQLLRVVSPVPGSQIRMDVVGGSVTLPGAPSGSTQQTLTTDAQGNASFQFIPNRFAPVQLRFTIVGSQSTLSVSVLTLLN
jgi:hypothetical protein